MKILFISRHIPYGRSTGIEVKIANLLGCMREVAEVTCVHVVDDTRANRDSTKYFKENDYAVMCKTGDSSVARYLRHLREHVVPGKDVREQLHAIISRTDPDLIWLEFGYVCSFLPFLRRYGKPVYYGSHNSQWRLDYEIWRANGNPAYKMKMAPFILLYWLQERFVMGAADRFFCISRHDIDYYRRFVPGEKLSLLPFFFDCRDFDNVVPLIGREYVCLVGSLRSYQNYAAAVYTLEKIWPHVHAALKNLTLYVIGELPAADSPEYRQLMQKTQECPGVVLTGRVDSVIPYVKGALVNMVPLTLGSGVRTKIIESAACRTPVVSTSIGAEGLPFEDGRSILIADEPLQFADAVIALATDGERRRSLAENAFEAYRRELSFEAGTAMLARILAGPGEAADAPVGRDAGARKRSLT